MIPDDQLNDLIRLLEGGDSSIVAETARRFLLEAPDDGRLLEIYGVACFDLREFEVGRAALEEATCLVPLSPMAQFALATCYGLRGEGQLAALMYEHLTMVACDTAMLSAIARRLGGLGRDESALATCRRIVALAPEHHQASFGEAYYLRRLGRPPQELVTSLERAVKSAPSVLTYRVNLAFALDGSGRIEEACEVLRVVAIESIDCPCLLRRMKDLFARGGDDGRALTCGMRLACVLQ